MKVKHDSDSITARYWRFRALIEPEIARKRVDHEWQDMPVGSVARERVQAGKPRRTKIK